jgi:glycerophosphoryl diester phosphodiesterase
VSKIKEASFQLFPWTVNQPEDIAALIDLGVDGIITDFPERVPKK